MSDETILGHTLADLQAWTERRNPAHDFDTGGHIFDCFCPWCQTGSGPDGAHELGAVLLREVLHLRDVVAALLGPGLNAEEFRAKYMPCTTADCDGTDEAWVVLLDCEDEPCNGHGYCWPCARVLTGGHQPSGFLGHRPTAAPPPPTEGRDTRSHPPTEETRP